MKIAVLSGKGGAGKTLVAANLAATAKKATYIDCDVEEPNGRLFFKPEGVVKKTVTTLLPHFDPTKCSGCRTCVDFCHFNALMFIKDLPRVFPDVCHACGGCSLVCPDDAITELPRPLGTVETGTRDGVTVVTGILNPGEASGVPVIRAALDTPSQDLTVIDCPPGSACSVMESIMEADSCLLVTEPTAFGFHNMQMVYELAALLKKPCGVVINKMEQPYLPLEKFCQEHNLPILARIPYRQNLAASAARGELVCQQDPQAAEIFARLLTKLGGDPL